VSDQRPLGLSPHIFVTDPDSAIGFYSDVFGADELFRQTLPDGTVLFIELAVGPAKLLVSQEVPALGALAPPTVGGSPVLLLLETDHVDAVAGRAVEAGAQIEMPVAEMFWGERYGIVRDPFGHRWALCTRREQLDPAEIAERLPHAAAPDQPGRA
jgi:PhnB protein